MTHKQAKSELMQIYGFLSEEKKKAIDVAVKALQEQADRNEFYNWDAPIRHKADGEYISIKYIHSVLHNHMFDNAHKPTIYAELKRISKELDRLTVAIPSAEPCEDAISREEAKQFLYERIDRLNDDELYDIFSRIIDDMYNDLPSIKSQEPKWIPVSELPKDKMTCLVYGKMHFTPDHVNEKDWYYDYTIGYYKPKYGWSVRGNMHENDVIAWMPLPKPYEP